MIETAERTRSAIRVEETRERGLPWLRQAALGLPLLALALRVFRLDYPSLWYDEAFGAYLAKLDLSSLTQHTAGDIHPPLYYYLLHFWIRLAGDSVFAMRFLAVVFGVLLVAMVYRFTLALTRRLGDRQGAPSQRGDARVAAVLAALLVATNPFQLWYSQENRMYTIAAVLGLALTWLLLELSGLWGMEAPGRPGGEGVWRERRRAWAGYVAVAAVGLYLLYYMAFLLVFLSLFALAAILVQRRRDRRSPLLLWLSAQLAVIALYLPWLPVAIRQAIVPAVPPWREFVALDRLVGEAWSALALGQSVEAAAVWPYLLLFLLVYGLGVWQARRRPLAGVLLVGSVWGPLLLIYGLSFWSPLFHVRYVFPYAPLFYVTLALGIIWLGRRWRAWAALIAIVFLGAQATSAVAYFADTRYARDDFRGAAQFVDRSWRDGDAILLDAGYIYPALTYYLKTPVAWRGRLTDYAGQGSTGPGAVILETGSIGGSASLGRGDPRADFYATTEAETAAALENVAQSHPRLWLVRCYDTVTDPGGFVRAWLAQHGLLIDDAGFSGSSNMRAQGYLLPAEDWRSAPTGGTDFGGRLFLAEGRVAGLSVPAGSSVGVDLRWRVQALPGPDFRAYLALRDESGRVWQQQDEKPVGRLYSLTNGPAGLDLPDPRRFEIPTGTPPGRYRVMLGVYDGATGQALNPALPQGAAARAELDLGSLEVVRPDAPGKPPPMQHAGRSGFGAIDLIGYNIGTYVIKPGETLGLELLWQAVRRPGDDLQAAVEIVDGGGRVWAQQTGEMVDGRYPTGRWHAGEMVRDQRDLVLPANTPDGSYRLVLRVSEQARSLGTLNVRGRQRIFSAPGTVANPLDAQFGSYLQLVGFELSGAKGTRLVAAGSGRPSLEAEPGEVLHLTLYWRAVEASPRSLTVFTQLLDAQNRVQGQRDQVPGGGELPTTSWVAGEYLVDDYELAIKAEAPAGETTLVVGAYDPASGARQPLTRGTGAGNADALPLAHVTILRRP